MQVVLMSTFQQLLLSLPAGGNITFLHLLLLSFSFLQMIQNTFASHFMVYPIN